MKKYAAPSVSILKHRTDYIENSLQRLQLNKIITDVANLTAFNKNQNSSPRNCKVTL
jgi:hypothetical protein